MAAALALIAWPAQTQQRFSSRVQGVRVDVLVTDGSRRVPGLTAQDFEVRDNGVPQQITAIDVERVPLNVLCVFDASFSVEGTRLTELIAAGRALVDQLRDIDRMALLSFATHIGQPLPLTSDHDRLKAAIAAVRPTGLTSLRDAVFAGLALRDADPARTLLLVFSDGDDTSSWLSAQRVIDAAKRTDVVIDAVRTPDVMSAFINGWYGPPTTQPRPPLPFVVPPRGASTPHEKFLDAVAAETGGRVAQVKADRDLTATFTSMLGEFRDRYVLNYMPAGVSDSGWHVLAVRVKGKSVKVTARRGYFAQR